MRRLLWLGLFLLSSSWLFLTPILAAPNLGLGFALLVGGTIINVLGVWGAKVKHIDRKYSILFVPLIISLFFIPSPYFIGSILLILGMVAAAIAVHFGYSRIAPLWIGLIISGLLLTIHALIFRISVTLVACYPGVDALAPLTSPVIHAAGLSTALHEGTIVVSTAQGALPFTVTWMKLGVYPWIFFFAGAVALFFLTSRKAKNFSVKVIGFLILSGVYAIIRYVFLVFVAVETEVAISDFSVFWDPLYITLSFIPFAFLMIKFYHLDGAELNRNLNPFKTFRVDRRRLGAMVAIFLFVFSLMGARWFQDPGTPKGGRILMDDLYGAWENSSRKMDTEWYGELSTYNYYDLAEWLNHYYQLDRNLDHAIDSGLLQNYDVLILKCLTSPLSEEEIDAVVQFVEGGGGLLLIGDHTNVFGMSSYFNPLSERFGVKFNFDMVNDLSTGKLQVYEPPTVLAHPIVQNVQSYQFMTSCSLSASPLVEPVILGYGVVSDKGDYAHQHFFGTERRWPNFDYGPLLQCVAVKYGAGRVVVYSDSTCFSNYSMFDRGYPEFMLGCMEYLNRTNAYTYINSVFLVVAIAMFILAIYLLRKEKKAVAIFLILLVGLLAVSSGIFAFSRAVYSLPQPHTEYVTVCLDEEHGYAKARGIETPEWGKGFGTFLVWTQRVGCTPSYESTLESALEKGDAVVIINPTKDFTVDDINAVASYISRGGKLLLMDGALNADSTANELLYYFGMYINRTYADKNIDNIVANLENVDNIGIVARPALSIYGGTPVLLADNLVALSVYEQNGGKLVVVDSFMFSDARMGGVFTVPDQATRELYNLEYYIFENILGVYGP
jgi:hypothetical protein